MNGFVSSRSTSTLCVCARVCVLWKGCVWKGMQITKDSVIVYKLFPLTRTSIQIQMVLGEFSATEKKSSLPLGCGTSLHHTWEWHWSHSCHPALDLNVPLHYRNVGAQLKSPRWCPPFLWDISSVLLLNSNILSTFHPFPICWKYSLQT